MPTRPHNHPLATARPGTLDRPVPAPVIQRRPRPRVMPAEQVVPPGEPGPVEPATPTPRVRPGPQDGSVATEYGLLAVVAATIVSVLLEWATSGGISDLLGAILTRVADLVGL